MNPISCQYVQSVHNFNCGGGCGVRNPAGWALDGSKGIVFEVQDALIVIKNILSIMPETVFNAETMTACGVLYRHEPAVFQSFRNNLRGKVQLREFDKILKSYIPQKDNPFHIVQDGGRPTLQESLPAYKVELVSPILTYEDIEPLQELVRAIRKARAVSDMALFSRRRTFLGWIAKAK